MRRRDLACGWWGLSTLAFGISAGVLGVLHFMRGGFDTLWPAVTLAWLLSWIEYAFARIRRVEYAFRNHAHVADGANSHLVEPTQSHLNDDEALLRRLQQLRATMPNGPGGTR